MFGICSGASRLAPERFPNIIFDKKNIIFSKSLCFTVYFVQVRCHKSLRRSKTNGFRAHQTSKTSKTSKHQKHHFSKLSLASTSTFTSTSSSTSTSRCRIVLLVQHMVSTKIVVRRNCGSDSQEKESKAIANTCDQTYASFR